MTESHGERLYIFKLDVSELIKLQNYLNTKDLAGACLLFLALAMWV